MITPDDLIEAGHITRLHGLKGELNATISDPVFDDVQSCPYFIIEMDGIYVPFFVDSYRMRGNGSMLLKLDDVDSQDRAATFCGKTFYFDRRCFTPEEAEAYDAAQAEEQGVIGYTVIDETLGPLGPITYIDDQTANVLFFVDHQGDELMIPAADPLIVDVDHERRTITMRLPAGLVNEGEAETE